LDSFDLRARKRTELIRKEGSNGTVDVVVKIFSMKEEAYVDIESEVGDTLFGL